MNALLAAILFVGSVACSTSGGLKTNPNANVRIIAIVDDYQMNGAWLSPDEIIPSILITVESPERYAGKNIEIGLIPVAPSDDHLFDEIRSLVGERVSLDLPEPVRENTYQIPPRALNVSKEPNRVGGGN